jgi:hypothetical protein
MKAVVVPSNSQPIPLPPPSPVRYTVMDSTGTSVYPPLYAQNMVYTSAPSPIPARDPMVDYYALYGHQDVKTATPYNSFFPNSLSLQNYEVENKMWELRTAIDWINAECEDVVLIQRSIDASSWLMVFISNRDYLSFMTWYGGLTIRRFTVSLATPEREKEYEEWMVKNIHDRKRVYSHMQEGRKVVSVSVADKNEELLFKLRWVGVPDEDDEVA